VGRRGPQQGALGGRQLAVRGEQQAAAASGKTARHLAAGRAAQPL